jgi:hypothetical protein
MLRAPRKRRPGHRGRKCSEPGDPSPLFGVLVVFGPFGAFQPNRRADCSRKTKMWRSALLPCMHAVETRNSGIESSSRICAQGRGLEGLYIYPHGTRHLHVVAPPFLHRTPALQPANTNTKTNYHGILPSIMSLFALILDALAGTVTILSAPKLLVDRVLAHLCRWPLPFSLIFTSS